MRSALSTSQTSIWVSAALAIHSQAGSAARGPGPRGPCRTAPGGPLAVVAAGALSGAVCLGRAVVTIILIAFMITSTVAVDIDIWEISLHPMITLYL